MKQVVIYFMSMLMVVIGSVSNNLFRIEKHEYWRLFLFAISLLLTVPSMLWWVKYWTKKLK